MVATVDIDLWVWNLEPSAAEVGRLEQFLSADERTRAARFLSPAHGAHYIVGRGRMREILGQYTQTPPADLRFVYGASGKPELADPKLKLSFNLSHTGALAALAVAPSGPLGIDVETLRPLKEDIARRFFSETEVAALEAHPPEQRIAAFYRCWTRKEAFVKATGDGLGFPLDAFDVSIDDATEPRLTRIAGSTAGELKLWHLAHLGPETLPPGAKAVGAIAYKAADPATRIAIRHCK